jgi:hypothetical protein
MATLPRWVMLLASLLVACTAVSPGVHQEDVPSRETTLVAYGEWHAPTSRPPPLVQFVSSDGKPEAPGPSGPRGQPLTRERLLILAASKGVGLTPILVQRNREVGTAFQWTLCRALNVVPNTAAFATPGRTAYKSVILDGVLAAVRINILGGPTFRLDGAFLEVIGPESFLEVKAQQRPITLSTGQGQIQGYIQVLSRQRPRSFLPGIPEPPRPALLLLTTADTQVSQQVADEAGLNGVAVYHAVAWEDGGLLTVGPFRQRTGFADVPTSFALPSVPTPLQPQPR